MRVSFLLFSTKMRERKKGEGDVLRSTQNETRKYVNFYISIHGKLSKKTILKMSQLIIHNQVVNLVTSRINMEQQNHRRKISEWIINKLLLLVILFLSLRCKWIEKTRPPNIHTIPNAWTWEGVPHKSLSYTTKTYWNGSCTLPHRTTN
jgi:hypothetical protein